MFIKQYNGSSSEDTWNIPGNILVSLKKPYASTETVARSNHSYLSHKDQIQVDFSSSCFLIQVLNVFNALFLVFFVILILIGLAYGLSKYIKQREFQKHALDCKKNYNGYWNAINTITKDLAK